MAGRSGSTGRNSMIELRDRVAANLSVHIAPEVVEDLLSTYGDLLTKHRSGDFEAALTKAGRFVEHTLRAIEFIRTGSAPAEIKSVQSTIRVLENETSLSESLRLLIPRALYGMIYNLRSKRDAVHVKEIDPRHIDVAMSVSAASWVIAELVRLFHEADEAVVEQCMLALSRTSLPFIETLDGETIVGRKVDSRTEMLLLLAHAGPDGLTRREIGLAAKCSPSAVTTALRRLINDRYVHLAGSKRHFITAMGEMALAESLTR